jgi:hypothetical protein
MTPFRRSGVRVSVGLSMLLFTIAWSDGRVDLIQTVAHAQSASVGVTNDPPAIYFLESPALHIQIDGVPVYRPIEGTDLERIINTNALILRDPAGIHYLKVVDGWMESYMLTGYWSPSGGEPEGARTALARVEYATLANLFGGDGVSAAITGAVPQLSDRGPTILVSRQATELIVTDGPPVYKRVEGSSLEYLANSAAHVFREPTDQELYVLLAGRWFRGWTENGPWEYIDSRDLPADIAHLTATGPWRDVKASIAGTSEARDAIVAATTPHVERVSRRKTMSVPVVDGDPIFAAIDGTRVRYLVNSPMPVVSVDAHAGYFAVENGVWFAAPALQGPWQVATAIPGDIYAIPPSAPLHFVTYVHVVAATADDVSVGVTAGYSGAIVSNGVVVYGTGYTYAPWIGTHWYGHPVTYGVGANLVETATGWQFGFALGRNSGVSSQQRGGPAFAPAPAALDLPR